ncbi:MAG TPA: hypothetical protein VK070_05835 [Acidimicrobiia bacterium]|nr:hypothetical protein [Acidimicrobiia bacterium]
MGIDTSALISSAIDFPRTVPNRAGRRRSMAAQLSLSPMKDRSGRVRGYLATMPRAEDPDHEITALDWTVRTHQTLDPKTFLAAPLSPAALLQLAESSSSGEQWWAGIMVILEPARFGRRQAEHRDAVDTLRALGLQVGLSGHRVADACGYDALLVEPSSAAAEIERDGALLIVTGIVDADALRWAEENDADLYEGPAIGAPIRIAPIDVSRLTR